MLQSPDFKHDDALANVNCFMTAVGNDEDTMYSKSISLQVSVLRSIRKACAATANVPRKMQRTCLRLFCGARHSCVCVCVADAIIVLAAGIRAVRHAGHFHAGDRVLFGQQKENRVSEAGRGPQGEGGECAGHQADDP